MTILPSKTKIPEGFLYRRATEDDTKAIVDLVSSVLLEYGLPVELKSTDSDLFDTKTHYKEGYFGVITKEDNIVATYGITPIDAHATEIRKMYALPNARGKGLGKWMVNHLIQLSKENNYKFVELETSSLLKEAVGLYEHMGFEEIKSENKTLRCDKSYKLKI